MPKIDYAVLIEPLSDEAGGGFLATVPDLPDFGDSLLNPAIHAAPGANVRRGAAFRLCGFFPTLDAPSDVDGWDKPDQARP